MSNLPTLRQTAPSTASATAAGVGIGDLFSDPLGVEAPGIVQGPASAQTVGLLGLVARTAAPFAAGQGWTLVAPTAPLAGTSAATFVAPNIARFTIASIGAMGGLTGPRVERPIVWDAGKRWRVRVTPRAFTLTAGFPNGDLFLRNAAASQYVSVELTAVASPGDLYAIRTSVALAGPAVAAIPWDGTSTIELRFCDTGLVAFGGINGSGVFVPVGTAQFAVPFTPSHVGVMSPVGALSVGVVEFTDLIVEALP